MTATIKAGKDEFIVHYDASTEGEWIECNLYTGIPLNCTAEEYQELQRKVAKPDSWKLFPPFCNYNPVAEDEEQDEADIVICEHKACDGKCDAEEVTTQCH